MRQSNLALAAVALSAAAGTTLADIVQDQGVFDRAISPYDPMGQTFEAVDSHIATISLAFSDINPSFPNDPVTMSVYEGAGFGGTLLASRVLNLPAVLPSTSATPVFYDVDFTGLVLTIGGTYTIAVSTTSSPKVAVVFSDANPYAGGSYVSAVEVNPNYDLNFRVIAVPAPASVAALALCFAGTRRRR